MSFHQREISELDLGRLTISDKNGKSVGGNFKQPQQSGPDMAMDHRNNPGRREFSQASNSPNPYHVSPVKAPPSHYSSTNLANSAHYPPPIYSHIGSTASSTSTRGSASPYATPLPPTYGEPYVQHSPVYRSNPSTSIPNGNGNPSMVTPANQNAGGAIYENIKSHPPTYPPPPPPAHAQAHAPINSSPLYENLIDLKKRACPQVPVKKSLLNRVTVHRPKGPTEAEKKVEALTQRLEEEMAAEEEAGAYFGICSHCGKKVVGKGSACQAMGNMYHTTCFVCTSCSRQLMGKAFYNVNGKVYCEEDYLYCGFQETAMRCTLCGHLIMETILQAMGKPYHPGCFRCTRCMCSLDGVPFTLDRDDKIYCVQDYHELFAPICASCGKCITPIEGTEETVRVVSMDKDFHVDCYSCETCGIQLTDEPDKRCYPLDGHLLCRPCHFARIELGTHLESVPASYHSVG